MKSRIVISSVSPGYMFGVNATINALHHFGTQAEIHLLHRHMTPDVMEMFSKHAPLPVRWIDPNPFGIGYNTPKYGYAASLANACDSVCLIDGDLFVCANIDEHFARAEDGLLTTAEHEHAGGNLNALNFASPTSICDRSLCQLADFPVFADPWAFRPLFQQWHREALEINGTEYNHPLIAFNRAVATHCKRDQVVALDGHHWVADMRYWIDRFRVSDKMLYDTEGRIFACHNRWWAAGRAAGELLVAERMRNTYRDSQYDIRVTNGEANFNLIVSLMKEYVAMNPAAAVPCAITEPFDRSEIVKKYGPLT